MIINQTVDNHEDLLKVVDNMLSEVGVSRSELKGELTFAGLDPIRPTVLKVHGPPWATRPNAWLRL